MHAIAWLTLPYSCFFPTAYVHMYKLNRYIGTWIINEGLKFLAKSNSVVFHLHLF